MRKCSRVVKIFQRWVEKTGAKRGMASMRSASGM